MMDPNDEVCIICKQWGVGYQGSKNKHVKWLFDYLPAGKRFVDLFGGGFSASHYAIETRRYPIVIYSDCDPFIVKLIQKCACGDYDIGRFEPYWVDKETFDRIKNDLNADQYIRYAFSYGNKGSSYIGSDKVQYYNIWKDVFEFCLTMKLSDLIKSLCNDDFDAHVCLSMNYNQRYSYLYSRLKFSGKAGPITDIRRYIKAGRAARKGVIIKRDYTDYKYVNGDVVYCDIPYVNTKCEYNNGFDYNAFYDFARETPCFISEYQMPDDFVCIAEKHCITTMNDNFRSKRVERLFASPAAIKEGLYDAHNQLCFDWGRDNTNNTKRDIINDDISEECGYRADIKGFGAV